MFRALCLFIFCVVYRRSLEICLQICLIFIGSLHMHVIACHTDSQRLGIKPWLEFVQQLFACWVIELIFSNYETSNAFDQLLGRREMCSSMFSFVVWNLKHFRPSARFGIKQAVISSCVSTTAGKLIRTSWEIVKENQRKSWINIYYFLL